MLNVERFCPRCNRMVLALRKPVYDGFTKVGEVFTCTLCGQKLESEGETTAEPSGITAKEARLDRSRSQLTSLLGEVLPDRPTLKDDGSASRLCRYCVHYTINPFRQWCGRHRRDVEATDTCGQFEKAPEPEPEAADEA